MGLEQIKQRNGELVRQGALKDMLQMGLLAAGLGGAVRGGAGLLQLGRRNFGQVARPAANAPVTIDVQVPPRPEEEDASPMKTAEEAFSFSGAGNSAPQNWWGYYPMLTAGGLGGLYGGWKATDALMDHRRKKELSSELEQAKQEYEQALRGTSKLGQDLDRLYDVLEKQANLADDTGPLVGGLATVALLGALGSGGVTYGMTRKRDPSAIKERAKQQYRSEQYRRRPSPIFARPVPVAPSVNDAAPSEDELEGEPLDKVAGADWGERLKKLQARRGDRPVTKKAGLLMAKAPPAPPPVPQPPKAPRPAPSADRPRPK